MFIYNPLISSFEDNGKFTVVKNGQQISDTKWTFVNELQTIFFNFTENIITN